MAATVNQASTGSTLGFWVTLGLAVLSFWLYQRSSHLTASLATAQAQNAQLRVQLTQLQSQVADLQQHIAHDSTQTPSAAMPDLPVQVTFRQALFAGGMVGTFTNVSSAPLQVVALFQSDATHQQFQRPLTLPPNRPIEIGAAQGWEFLPGHTVTLTNAGFKPLEKVVQ